ncbi:ABC transporter permease [Virgibacillus flavescens]|uniref:ABC transporter permease n=1 Tax=Virgibacillus flavescens TaxID=1611422 RepID=UPI003D344DCE
MGNLLKTEWYKLRKDRTFWVLTGLLIVFSVLYPLDRIGISDSPNENDFYRGFILAINSDIVSLLPAILAGFFIASEFSMGTMKSIASSGHSRVKIYFAKLTVFSIGSIIILLILPIFMMVASAGYIGFYVWPDWTYYLRTIGLISLYGTAYASIMALFSVIFADSGKTIAFLLLFLASIDSLLDFLRAKVPFLEPMITHSIFMSHGSILTIDQIGNWNGDDVLTFIVVPILTSLVLGTLGSLIFRYKEIK